MLGYHYNTIACSRLLLGYRYDSAAADWRWLDGSNSTFTNWQGKVGSRSSDVVGEGRGCYCALLHPKSLHLSWLLVSCLDTYTDLVCERPVESK